MQTIKDILSEHGVPFTISGEGRAGWLQCACPDCGSMSSKGYEKFYLGISLTSGASNCWRCGKKDTARVLAALTGRSRSAMRDKVEGADLSTRIIRPKGTLKLPKGREALLPAHEAYLRKRGFDPATVAALWGVEAIGQAPALGWRLFIPIYHAGEIVSWTTRSIKPHEKLRYVSAAADGETVPHKTILYGADYARHAVIIHEGPIDVWATGPGAVATCGTGYTEAQLLAMSKYSVRVVCYDNEPDAQNRAAELADALSVYPGETYNVQLETGNDAAEADPAEIRELRATFLE